MPVERIRIYKEKKRLSPWFLMIPLILLIAFLAYFLARHTSGVQSAAASPGKTSSYLPDLGVVYFDPDQPTLTADGQATLDRAADAMHGNPNVCLRLEGYADAPKRAPRRASLPQQRTQAVGRYLESKGIDHTRIAGGSFSQPATANAESVDTASGDGRRVELFVR